MGDKQSQFAKRPQFSFASSSSRIAAPKQRPVNASMVSPHGDDHSEASESNAAAEQIARCNLASATSKKLVFTVPADPTTPNPPSKRRRVFHNEALSPTWPAHSVQGSSSKLFSARPRFETTPKTGEPSTQATGGTEGRPSSTPLNKTRFVLPSEPEPDQSATTAPALLPDAFSPHRRKERFVPGGWASQMRTWALDASTQTGTSSSSIGCASGPSASAIDDDAVTVRVMAVQTNRNNEPPILLRCTVLNTEGQHVNILLAGSGERVANSLGAARAQTEIQAESILKLQPPIWDIVLQHGTQAQGEVWVVCSRWRLSQDTSI